MRAFAVGAVCILATACVPAAELTPCPKDLERITAPYPPYPSPEQAESFGVKGTSYMHVYVEGRVAVEFTVTTDGTLDSLEIVESTYQIVGRNRHAYATGHFSGFLEMNVLSTLAHWRYKRVQTPCRGKFTFTYKMRDAA